MSLKNKIKGIVFDFDGTLVDTLQDIAESANLALIENNLDPYPIDSYKNFVGEGSEVLIDRIIPKKMYSEELKSRLLGNYSEIYRKNWWKNSKPYKGILEVLDYLKEGNYIVAILSNKPDPFTKEMANFFFPEFPFLKILGARSQIPKKPNPMAIYEIISYSKLESNNWSMIGDTAVDINTAKNAEILPIGVLWGFRPDEILKEKNLLYINQPKDIISILKND
jgi:phosphoglycolate phosphatase